LITLRDGRGEGSRPETSGAPEAEEELVKEAEEEQPEEARRLEAQGRAAQEKL
jgi:hypothetical protein